MMRIFSKESRGDRQNERGAALIFALSLLAIFGFIGVAYVEYMSLSLVESDLGLRKARARHLAAAGIEIAAAGLREEVLSPNHQVPKGVPASFDLATYKGIRATEEGIFADPMSQPRIAKTTITVYDESSRVNLNHAPASALQKLLGVSGDTARTIAASVPRGAQGPDARWFLSVDELLSRGLLTREQYDLIVPNALTTFTVLDNANPTAYFNANEADPVTLAAMLNLTVEQASQIKSKGPFASLEALGQAISSVTGAPPAATDPAIGLKSRCFRVVSEGFYAKVGDSALYEAASPEDKMNYLTNRTRNRVEAVLMFQEDGTYEVLHWDATAGASDEDASIPQPAPVEPGTGGTATTETESPAAAGDGTV